MQHHYREHALARSPLPCRRLRCVSRPEERGCKKSASVAEATSYASVEHLTERCNVSDPIYSSLKERLIATVLFALRGESPPRKGRCSTHLIAVRDNIVLVQTDVEEYIEVETFITSEEKQLRGKDRGFSFAPARARVLVFRREKERQRNSKTFLTPLCYILTQIRPRLFL